MRIPAALASGPFTAAEASALGVGRGVLSGPSVRRLFDGVYITAGREPDLVDWVRAAEQIFIFGRRDADDVVIRMMHREMRD